MFNIFTNPNRPSKCSSGLQTPKSPRKTIIRENKKKHEMAKEITHYSPYSSRSAALTGFSLSASLVTFPPSQPRALRRSDRMG